MADFPTITRKPLVFPYEEGLAFDPTLRSNVEAGYVISRSKFTRTPDKFNIEYAALPTADKDLIRAHEIGQNVGAEIFDWFNVFMATPATISVRYFERVKYTPADSAATRWKVSFILEEV